MTDTPHQAEKPVKYLVVDSSVLIRRAPLKVILLKSTQNITIKVI